MGLRDIYLKKSYDSDIDDLLNDFYVPTLSNSIKYQRLAGFFSSSSLAVAARGISNFIKNDGHMELVCSARLNKDDLESIKSAYKNPEEVIEDLTLLELEKLENGIIKDHVAALGWMIANEKLKIKIAISIDKNGFPIDESLGIFHLKVGIMVDAENNMLSFSGSINETQHGWKHNIEETKVFKNWIKEEKDYFDDDLKTFYRYWEGKSKKVKVYDIPEAVKKELIKIAPNDIAELNLDKAIKPKKPVKKLWKHQETAITKWIDNEMKGILAMATGTGKTYTALGCIEEVFNQNPKVLCIISCPKAHLVNQWADDLTDFGFDYDTVIASGSINRHWKDDLNELISNFKNGIINHGIIITTFDTLSSKKFCSIIDRTKGNFLTVVDEVHGIGTKKYREGLRDQYNYRLGLSATPTRYFDDEGTDIILEYFDGTVFEFSIKDALNTINPDTGEFFLTPYKYKPCFVDLNSEELLEYDKLTAMIARQYYNVKNKDAGDEKLQNLCFKRQNILNNASNKYKMLKKVLRSYKNLDHCLIYCSPEQMNVVRNILKEENIKPYTKFTMKEGTKKEKKFGGISEREYILKEFEKDTYKVLVAMRCLDEGVDIPTAKIAIIMSSSSNPREYIQRRGRVLRRAKNKDIAIIHYFVISNLYEKKLSNSEKKIRKKELKRYREFASTAINRAECLSKLQTID
ncbi:MAG: DEAD/DEAH box helicase family protein [Methanobacteriaceae archaeon]|nr:DEAD/DEAH box helicase family protein [Methanobacteriaceae archaeon]